MGNFTQLAEMPAARRIRGSKENTASPCATLIPQPTMDSALAILRREHQRMLAAAADTEALAAAIEAGRAVPAATLEAATEFFSLFAHRVHRDKEEDLLFPELRRKGVRETSCIGPLLSDHDDATAAFAAMQQATDPRPWARAARRYCDRLRYHVRREEIVLANAEQLLSSAEQQALAEQFAQYEDKARRSGLAERIEAAERVLASFLSLT